jgi:hypothetical protein
MAESVLVIEPFDHSSAPVVSQKNPFLLQGHFFLTFLLRLEWVLQRWFRTPNLTALQLKLTLILENVKNGQKSTFE